ncbi:MAG TPA: DoxX family protein [Candidatus Omnitrophota bacterium]|nr:DoxX family protein [Candidatus Omnitrophota bacterium]
MNIFRDKGMARDMALFIIRMALGVIFVAHGAQKLFGMFGGIGLEGTTKMMEGLGFVHPFRMALVWSLLEFVGGAALILGFLSRYAAGFLTVLMIVSIWKINLAYGFFVQNGGYEYSMLIIGSCLLIILMGSGSWSIWDA